MNAEYSHQLYGGEVSDYFKKVGINQVPYNTNNINEQKLENIYSVQVKPVGQINITNSPTNMSLESLIEREPDPLLQQLQNTLTQIIRQQDFVSDNNINFKPTFKDQTGEDIQQANDAVLRALEELKSLGEL